MRSTGGWGWGLPDGVLDGEPMARKLLFKLLYLSSLLPALGSLNTPLLPVAFAKESYFGASVMACSGFEDSM